MRCPVGPTKGPGRSLSLWVLCRGESNLLGTEGSVDKSSLSQPTNGPGNRVPTRWHVVRRVDNAIVLLGSNTGSGSSLPACRALLQSCILPSPRSPAESQSNLACARRPNAGRFWLHTLAGLKKAGRNTPAHPSHAPSRKPQPARRDGFRTGW